MPINLEMVSAVRNREMHRQWRRTAAVGLLAAMMVFTVGGCDGSFVGNLVEERQGNVRVQFINNTPYRALLSVGSYDDLARFPVGEVTVQQRRVEANTATTVISLACRRNIAVNTSKLIRRIRDTDAVSAQNLDEDLLSDFIGFSAAPQGSSAESIPTAGTTPGVELLLGVDYTCEDLLILIFHVDPGTPSGFRVEFRLIQDEEDDA